MLTTRQQAEKVHEDYKKSMRCAGKTGTILPTENLISAIEEIIIEKEHYKEGLEVITNIEGADGTEESILLDMLGVAQKYLSKSGE